MSEMKTQTFPVNAAVSDDVRYHPVYFVQFGVLGDLSLTRLNEEIYKYWATPGENPFDSVYMCDVVSPEAIVEELFRRCVQHNCEEQYFERTPLEEVRSRFTDLEGQVDLIKKYRRKDVLTDLGRFLTDNYRCTKTTELVTSIPRFVDTSAHWIFYLAIDPESYENIIEAIAGALRSKVWKGRKMILLEKPFHKNEKKAENLKKEIEKLEKADPGLSILGVDHYAAKWAISRMPIFLKSFSRFQRYVDHVDEIIIELLEDKLIPDYRLGYMGTTGLYRDMITHALIPLQLLYSGKNLSFGEVVPLVVGSYEGYQLAVEKWQEGSHDRPARKNLRYDTYFSCYLDLIIMDDQVEDRHVKVCIRSGKAMCRTEKLIVLKQQGDERNYIIDIDNDEIKDLTGVVPGEAHKERNVNSEIKGYARIIYNAVQIVSNSWHWNHLRPSSFISPELATRTIKFVEALASELDIDNPDKHESYKIGGPLFLNRELEEPHFGPSHSREPRR